MLCKSQIVLFGLVLLPASSPDVGCEQVRNMREAGGGSYIRRSLYRNQLEGSSEGWVEGRRRS